MPISPGSRLALASEPERAARFEREARVLAALNHRGFQAASGFDVTPDGQQFLMAFPPSEMQSAEKTPLQIDVVPNWGEELKRLVK